MPSYRTTIESTWDVPRAFAFMSDFSNAQIWDPGVLSAARLDDGAIRAGSAFDLMVSFARRRMTLRYFVRTLQEDERVVFASWTKRLESVDTLTFEPYGAG